MGITKMYSEASKHLKPGPGGIKCPCCTPSFGKKEGHRAYRRIMKMKTKKEI